MRQRDRRRYFEAMARIAAAVETMRKLGLNDQDIRLAIDAAVQHGDSWLAGRGQQDTVRPLAAKHGS